ncbi:MAG: prolipoprotein diacylglyceryl transferase family protein, partial [Actinomycetota bacterium]
NNELYGGPTSVPWKLQIHCFDLTGGRAVACNPSGSTTLGYFQPTFLYELLWDLSLAVFLIWAARRWQLGRGNEFALYAMGYTLGRGWIEALRSDYAHHFLGLRLNDWTALLVFLGGLVWFLRHRDQRNESLYARPDAHPEPADPLLDEPVDRPLDEPVDTAREDSELSPGS